MELRRGNHSPLSSEVPLALVIKNSGDWVPVVVATLGNTLGACTTYWLARAGCCRRTSSRREDTPGCGSAKYGAPAMLLSRVPLIGDFPLVPAATGA